MKLFPLRRLQGVAVVAVHCRESEASGLLQGVLKEAWRRGQPTSASCGSERSSGASTISFGSSYRRFRSMPQ